MSGIKSERINFAALIIPAVCLALLFSFLFFPSCLAAASEIGSQQPLPRVIFPKASIQPEELAVIVNDLDPLSVEVGEYYRTRRGIPPENMIHVGFDPENNVMSLEEFLRVKAQVDALTPKRAQAFALAWTKPFRVECMSITTAFAAGFDQNFCADECRTTKPSPYFNSPTSRPFDDLGVRPAMMLAGESVEQVRKLIDRGVAADATYPAGTGYLVRTSDPRRNVRAAVFDSLVERMLPVLHLEQVQAEYLENRPDVLFYFTGSTHVPELESNVFLPGAVGDHLTSAGGNLADGVKQMNCLRWLEAGATGSYGTVLEPCNFVAKFPNPWVFIEHYTQGETLIEAYWKSVAMPGQGIFVGEPLAKPFGGYTLRMEDGRLVIRSAALPPGTYRLMGLEDDGRLNPVGRAVIFNRGMSEIVLDRVDHSTYVLMKAPDASLIR